MLLNGFLRINLIIYSKEHNIDSGSLQSYDACIYEKPLAGVWLVGGGIMSRQKAENGESHQRLYTQKHAQRHLHLWYA